MSTMDSSFVDLDILLTQIRNARSRTYFLEAVRSYKAGALRSSLTAIWVALVYDLITKYRELSASDDPAAKKFIQSWDTATDNNNTEKLQKLEKSILDSATNETQIINPIAYRHLKRLHNDRHLCAHPTFSAENDLFEPTPELVRLHLVNAVNLVLSKEPLRGGKAILELFDKDIQSTSFPKAYTRILDYVEQKYLKRIRTHNIQNFAIVLAKSLLTGKPPEWELQHDKIVYSLVAVSERATQEWSDISRTIVNLIDNLDPVNFPRAVAFIGRFPDFWLLLQEQTRIALQETVENANFNTPRDYRMLASVELSQFRESLLSAVANFDQNQLGDAIKVKPLANLWESAIKFYKNSSTWRGSEANFRELIVPFAGHLNSQQHDQLLDAVIYNGQNWDAAETKSLLFNVLRNANMSEWPTHDARNRFYSRIRATYRFNEYEELFEFLQKDGWAPALLPQQNDDE